MQAEAAIHEKISRNQSYSVSLNVEGTLIADGYVTLCAECAPTLPGDLELRHLSDARCAKCNAPTCCEEHDTARDLALAQWAASKNIPWPRPLPETKLVKEN